MLWPWSWFCVKVGGTVRTKKQHNVGLIFSLVWMVWSGKQVGHVVGFGLFVGHVVWVFATFGIFVGHRAENDRKKASVGRVVRSESDILELKIDQIRSAKLVVWFDLVDVTNKKKLFECGGPTMWSLSLLMLRRPGKRLESSSSWLRYFIYILFATIIPRERRRGGQCWSVYGNEYT